MALAAGGSGLAASYVLSGSGREGALVLVASVALLWRRRSPVLATSVVIIAVAAGAGELLLVPALASVAVRVRDRRLLGLVVAALAALAWVRSAVPLEGAAELVSFAAISATAFVGLPVAIGAYLGTRRDLLRQVQDRAEQLEAEQHLRAASARVAERAQIAHEMHDVLAHRISLVALHAGALEVRPSSSPEEVERTAGLIRTTAHQALEDLRGVLGVLQADATSSTRPLPQPTVDDIAQLVADSRAADVRVRLDDSLPVGSDVPELIGRTAFRLVQEGLTNVHKHAGGAAATVTLSGAPGDGLTVDVTNVRPVGRTAAPLVPGSGAGLAGLTERVRLSGGELHAGGVDNGGFRLHARLPWPVADGTANA